MVALQWPSEAKLLVLAYKYIQTPYFAKKEDFGKLEHFLCIFFSLFSVVLFQKHLQTHQNTFNSSLSTKITR